MNVSGVRQNPTVRRDIKVSLSGKKVTVLVASARPGETISHIREKAGFKKQGGGDWREVARFTAGTSYRLSEVESVLHSRHAGARLKGGVPFYNVGLEASGSYEKMDEQDRQRSTRSETDIVFIEVYGEHGGGLFSSKSKVSGYLEVVLERETRNESGSTESNVVIGGGVCPPIEAPSFARGDVGAGVNGLLPEELLILGEQGLPKVALEKLKNPDKRLSIDESISCLTGCINVGVNESKKSLGKEMVIFIGNTGAGKSTTVNFLHGCKMNRVKPSEVGQTGARKLVIVASSSEEKEMMVIGHTKESQTFIPKIESDRHMTYCDCPGFMDNRGAEINIANAVNIKAAIANAGSVRVMVLINFSSLDADKGRGIREMIKILSDLFGSEERLKANKQSLLIAVTKVPTNEEYSLKDIQDEICSIRGELTNELRDLIVVYDPIEQHAGGWLNREALRARIKALKPIQNPSHIFQTVLTGDDEQKLREIVDEITNRVGIGLRRAQYKEVKENLIKLKQLEKIDNIYVTRLIQTTMREVMIAMDKIYGELQTMALNKQFDVGDQILVSMETWVKVLGVFQEFKHLEAIYNRAKAFSERSKENERINRKVRKELDNLRLERTILESRIKKMEESKETSKKEIAELEKRLQSIQEQTQIDIRRAKAAFEAEKAQIRTEIQEAEGKDREKLEQALAQKESEQASLSEKMERQTAEQRNVLEQTIAANKRNQEEKNKEIESLRSKLSSVNLRQEQAAQQKKEQPKADLAAVKEVTLNATSSPETSDSLRWGLPYLPNISSWLVGEVDKQEIPIEGGGITTEAKLSQRLGVHMYIGTSAYRKIGIEGITLPEIPGRMLEEIAQMKQEGLKPLMVYDHGISMVELDQRLKRHAPDTKFYNYWWQKESFSNKTGTPGWLVIPTSDDGREPGSRDKTFLEQEREMNKRYRIATCREGALIALLTDVETGRKFLGPGTYGRVADKTATGFRAALGCFDGSGLSVYDNGDYFNHYFGLLVALRNS